mmetsp:Transcript_15849/g.37405  ORF Transcript_15849/g.37405 Transcript_15849/m.37405 type:complete len:232 (+) Transcript_15849:761-1456(+)
MTLPASSPSFTPGRCGRQLRFQTPTSSRPVGTCACGFGPAILPAWRRRLSAPRSRRSPSKQQWRLLKRDRLQCRWTLSLTSQRCPAWSARRMVRSRCSRRMARCLLSCGMPVPELGTKSERLWAANSSRRSTTRETRSSPPESTISSSTWTSAPPLAPSSCHSTGARILSWQRSLFAPGSRSTRAMRSRLGSSSFKTPGKEKPQVPAQRHRHQRLRRLHPIHRSPQRVFSQ